MRARLTLPIVDKMRSEYPALNVDQIAKKYGVSWPTAKKALGIESVKVAKKRVRPKAADNGRGEIEVVRMHLDDFWSSLSTAAKVQFLLGNVRAN